MGAGCDLAEAGMGHGGGDLTLEFKAYNDLVPAAGSAEYETTYRGDTHAFGNSEERLIRKVRGVRARCTASDRVWDPSKGEGRVAAHAGDYDDAVRVKRNTLILFLINLYGGLTPEAVKHVCVRPEGASQGRPWTAPSTRAVAPRSTSRLLSTGHSDFRLLWSRRTRGDASNAFRGSAPRRSMPSEARLSAAPPPHAHKAEGANLRAG